MNVVLGNQGEGIQNVCLSCVADVRLSGQNPDVLLTGEGSKTDAAINHSVVIVISADDLVVASGDVRGEFDLEVTFILGRVNDKSVAKTTAPLVLLGVPLVVEHTDVAVILERIVGCVADALFVPAVLVTDDFVPAAKEVINFEVLDDWRVLATADLMGSGGSASKGDSRE